MKTGSTQRYLGFGRGNRWIQGAALAAICLALAGCNRTARLDEMEERHPLLRKAIAAKRANDFDRAIEWYCKALDGNPNIARAHLELGLIYDSPKEDYIRAIYHYERYLELRPTAEKREMVEDLIHWARLSYAASLPEQPSGAVKLIAALKKQLDDLRDANRRLEAELRPLRDRAPRAATPQPSAPRPSQSTAALQPPAPAPAPAEPPVNMYRVQSGDTLSRIAVKMYNEASEWQKIYDANRDKLKRPESLRVGQMLVIP